MPPLTRNQIRGFWAAWAGWALDGMDSFIYALVLVPALRDLLPRSGIAATQANIGFYGGVLFAIFLVGWGFAFLWGPIADRFGRVRTLILTILCYSLFTFLGCAAASVWQLALFRFLAGVGHRRRVDPRRRLRRRRVARIAPRQGAAWMHTGYYFGTFLAAIVNYTIGARYGWRAVFAVGGTPALLVAFIRYGVGEPKRWQHRVQQLDRAWTARDAFFALFSPEYRRRTICQCRAAVRLHGRAVGRFGLRAVVRHLPRGARRIHRRRSRAHGVLRHHAALRRHHSGMPAAARRSPNASAGAARWRFYFLLMFALHRDRLRLRLLPARRRAAVVSGLPVLSGDRRREFRRLHAVAAGAVPHRMPRQRLRLRHVVRPLPRRRHHVPGGRRRRPHAHHRDARGAHLRRVPGGPRAATAGP